MKVLWVRLIAIFYLVAGLAVGIGHFFDKGRSPVLGVIFAHVGIVLMITAALAERNEKRIAQLERATNVSETKAV